MRAYEVEMIRDGKVKYFFIRNMETMEIELLPTRFLTHVALSLEYVKQYGEAHKELNYKQACLLEQCVARRSYNLYSDVQRGEML